MSGGYFDYAQYRLEDIAEAVDRAILTYGKGGGASYPPDIVEAFKRGANLLREAQVYAQRIDWLLSGDDGEDSFRSRLLEDLAQLLPYPEDESCEPSAPS